MRNEPIFPGSLGPKAGSRFLFAGLSVGGPLDELQATVEKKVRTYTSLKEAENTQRVLSAYEIARRKLEAVLAAPRTPAGS
jgi:hypothetical protein